MWTSVCQHLLFTPCANSTLRAFSAGSPEPRWGTTIPNQRRLHTIVSKNSISQISLPIYFGCYRFPSTLSLFLLVILEVPPAWTAASGLAIVNSESFCIKRPPSWSRVSMVDWVPCKCLDFWVKFSLCCWFWSDWFEEYDTKNTGITVTKTWGKGWGLEIKDQRQKTNAKLLVSLGWWFAILGVPLSNSPFHYKIQESKPQAHTTNLPLAVERQTRGKNNNENTG